MFYKKGNYGIFFFAFSRGNSTFSSLFFLLPFSNQAIFPSISPFFGFSFVIYGCAAVFRHLNFRLGSVNTNEVSYFKDDNLPLILFFEMPFLEAISSENFLRRLIL